jgi:group II intron reverse transcriptase/maturase
MAGRPRPGTVSTKQARIAELAKQMPGTALSTLSHHMDLDWLVEAYRRTRKDGAKGVDDQSAREYAENLEENLQDLLNRAKSGTYRAPPVKRVEIPKGDGRTRPIGIPTFEDKVLQRAVVMLLEPIYEQEFYDFSYGFRPHRSPHGALRALDEGLRSVGGGWVLDVDLKSFFDTISHEKLRQLVRQRVVDGVVTRLIGKWLKAGVFKEGVVYHSDLGTPQGGVISPLLANIYLHEALDKWWVETVLPRLRGPATMVRFADDFVMIFESRGDAERVLRSLVKRMAKYELIVHPEKTRLVRFGRPGGDGGGPNPGSFDFLGFTHFWSLTRKGRWQMRRKTSKKRFSRSLKSLNQWLRGVRHLPVDEQSRMLGSKLRGHFTYYGVAGNSDSINRFHYEARRLWKKWLDRRSQRARMTWEKFNRLLARCPLPPAKLRCGAMQLRLANL